MECAFPNGNTKLEVRIRFLIGFLESQHRMEWKVAKLRAQFARGELVTFDRPQINNRETGRVIRFPSCNRGAIWRLGIGRVWIRSPFDCSNTPFFGIHCMDDDGYRSLLFHVCMCLICTKTVQWLSRVQNGVGLSDTNTWLGMRRRRNYGSAPWIISIIYALISLWTLRVVIFAKWGCQFSFKHIYALNNFHLFTYWRLSVAIT